MTIQEMLRETNAVDAISRELGIDPATAEAGAAALLPSILSGFHSPAAAAELQPVGGGPDVGETGQPGGLGALLGTISGLGGGSLLDNVTSEHPTEVARGNEILGQIFGSKDGSRAVAAQAATQSGVEPTLLKRMLPLLAMVVAGYVMKQASQGSGGLGGALGGMFGGQVSPESPEGSAQAQPTAQGEILGDLIGMAGRYLRR